MTLTPEQFNKLAMKDDLKNYVTKDEFKKGIDEILTVLDGIAKSIVNNEAERASNMVAHDRFETRITRTEKELNLKPIYS